MAIKILTEWITINRNDEDTDIYVEGEVEYHSTSFGEDADGNRGWELDVIDDIKILTAQNDAEDEIALTDAEKERAITAITNKFVG